MNYFSNYVLVWRREIGVSGKLCANSRLILNLFGKDVVECDAAESLDWISSYWKRMNILEQIKLKTPQLVLFDSICMFCVLSITFVASGIKVVQTHHTPPNDMVVLVFWDIHAI